MRAAVFHDPLDFLLEQYRACLARISTAINNWLLLNRCRWQSADWVDPRQKERDAPLLSVQEARYAL
jgi:hypothetical protein